MTKDEVPIGTVVLYRNRPWLVRFSQSGLLDLIGLPEYRPLEATDWAFAPTWFARQNRVEVVGPHPLFKGEGEPQVGDYLLAFAYLGPNNPSFITGKICAVDEHGISYWRADGTQRQKVPCVLRGAGLIFTDPAVGEAHYQRDQRRFVPRAAGWWQDGRERNYDAAEARLKAQQPTLPRPTQMTLGDLVRTEH